MQHLRPLSNPGLTPLLQYTHGSAGGLLLYLPGPPPAAEQINRCSQMKPGKALTPPPSSFVPPIPQPGYLARSFVYYEPVFQLPATLPCSPCACISAVPLGGLQGRRALLPSPSVTLASGYSSQRGWFNSKSTPQSATVRRPELNKETASLCLGVDQRV